MVMDTFTHKGESYRRVPAEARDQFIIGVDLGQSMDPTAICVLHHQRVPLDSWTSRRTPYGNSLKQDSAEKLHVRHLERIRLGTPYPEIVGHVADILGRPPLRQGCDLVLDETGVGRPVADLFEVAGLRPIRVTITAGNEITNPERNRWHVPKATLISTLDARLHVGELKFAADLTEASALAEEMKDFHRKVTAAGRSTYNARDGKHDDLVLAVSIAVWWAVRPPLPMLMSVPVTGTW